MSLVFPVLQVWLAQAAGVVLPLVVKNHRKKQFVIRLFQVVPECCVLRNRLSAAQRSSAYPCLPFLVVILALVVVLALVLVIVLVLLFS